MIEQQDPKPGPWVDKKTGKPAELMRVDGEFCWYTIPEFRSEQVIATFRWLESMRPA
ncbi:MAG: hypothetical protein WC100_02505 [Sterolibacterium sp.]